MNEVRGHMGNVTMAFDAHENEQHTYVDVELQRFTAPQAIQIGERVLVRFPEQAIYRFGKVIHVSHGDVTIELEWDV